VTQNQTLFYVDSIEAFANKLSKVIDYELHIFSLAATCLDEDITAFSRNKDNYTSQHYPFVHKTSQTSNWSRTNSSKSGIPTHHVPKVYIEHTTSPLSPLHPRGGEDPSIPCESSTSNWSFTQMTHTIVTQAHLATRTTPNNPYNPMNPYTATIITQTND
jgi:hypothetical protein